MGTMRTNGWSSALLLALVLHSGAAMARTGDIYEPPKVLFVGADVPDAQQSRARIIAAGQSLGWTVAREEPGMVELHFDKQGKHQVNIAVRYDLTGYKIDYLNSFNLNYAEAGGQRKIHPNYNRWIRNLMQRIGSGL